MLDRQNLISINNNMIASAKKFFDTEACFWVVAALAGELALEEITQQEDRQRVEEILNIFNAALVSGKVEREEQIKITAIETMRKIKAYNERYVVYNREKCIRLSKAFVSYWLVFKLIELEWNEQTDAYDNADVYLFMDGLLADGEELDYIEKLLTEGKELSIDDDIYLRSNWQRVKPFWTETCEQAELIYAGFMDFRVVDFLAL